MSEDQALIIRDDSKGTVAFPARANALKESALTSAALIGKVTNGKENEEAVAAQAELQKVISSIEKARKACKEPVLEFGRCIDQAAKDFVEDLKPEMLRISTLIGDFAALEQAKVRAAEQARLAEERRIEAERNAEIARIAAEAAERNRKLAEAEREAQKQAAMAKNAEERVKADAARAEVEKQKVLAQSTSHEALDAVNAHFNNQASNLAAPVQATRAEGQRVTNDWEVTVSDVHTLYRFHPNCVKLDPLVGEIKNLLKAGVTVKGVTAKPIVKAGVRTNVARALTAIDV
jgi:hypothetical protein